MNPPFFPCSTYYLVVVLWLSVKLEKTKDLWLCGGNYVVDDDEKRRASKGKEWKRRKKNHGNLNVMAEKNEKIIGET